MLRLHLAAAAALTLTSGASLRAQDATPPVLVQPIADVVVPANSPRTVLSLKKTFGLNGVHGPLVRLTTNLGNIDLELFNDAAPDTVANFLRYVTSGSYTNTVFHRSTSLANDGLAIIQGGETTVSDHTITPITSFGNVNNEYSLPDGRGTIAMAKLGGDPNSASDQWFFNVSDNSETLNADNNGGFTVFGRVINGDLSTVDAIAGLQTYDLSSVRSDWTNIPLYNYDGSSQVTPDNLVLGTAATLPLVSKGEGYAGALKLKVKGNTNPDLVTATLTGRKLILTYTPGLTGVATITLRVKNAPHSKLAYTFNVRVE